MRKQESTQPQQHLNIYDANYLAEYDKRADTELGRKIYQARWKFVTKFCQQGVLLDYGCANGAFHREAPDGIVAHGFDINPFSGYKELHRGMDIDILTMWDVIEHLPDPTFPFQIYKPTWVFVCTPNIHYCESIPSGWKHFKPGEHIHYHTYKTLNAFMLGQGYEWMKWDTTEGELRDISSPNDIMSGAYKCLT